MGDQGLESDQIQRIQGSGGNNQRRSVPITQHSSVPGFAVKHIQVGRVQAMHETEPIYRVVESRELFRSRSTTPDPGTDPTGRPPSDGPNDQEGNYGSNQQRYPDLQSGGGEQNRHRNSNH